MKEFETIGLDGRVYLHYQNWERWRADRMQQYPCPHGRYRFDIELAYPRERLEDVPVEHNPHSFGLGPHVCFYCCDNWSTIFGVHDAHLDNHLNVDTPSLRMMVESGCPEPIWGERITLLSTSRAIITEPWGWGIPNRFALFRGHYWLVTVAQLLHHYHDVHLATGIGFCPLMCNIRGEPRTTRLRAPIAWDVFAWPDDFRVLDLQRYWPEPDLVDWHAEGF
jgi:hypothetical protein